MTLALAILLQSSDIDRWIVDLGAEEVAAREAATARLLEAGDDAVDALIVASASDDLETVARAKALLDAIVGDPATPERERALSEAAKTRLEETEFWNGFKGHSMASVGSRVFEVTGVPVHVVGDGGQVVYVKPGLTGDWVLRYASWQSKMSAYLHFGVVVIAAGSGDGGSFGPVDLPGPSIEALTSAAGERARTVRRLGRRVDVGFENAALKTTLRSLADQTGVTAAVDDDVDEVRPMTVQLASVPAHVALRLICLEAGLRWSIESNGTIRVGH